MSLQADSPAGRRAHVRFSFSGFLGAAQNGSMTGVHGWRDSTGADLVVKTIGIENPSINVALFQAR